MQINSLQELSGWPRAQAQRFLTGRAWVQVSLSALKQNLSLLRHTLPSSCEVMAVVKAEAYGHGAQMVARTMFLEGVRHFAVASVLEGVALRRDGISGEILVLGYTHPSDFPLLLRYNLTQSVVDADYANLLNAYGKKVRVHVKIDTGMNRLGIDSRDFDALKAVYRLENLLVTGSYTHLCSAEGIGEKERTFTAQQVARFEEVVARLQTCGIHPGSLHVQSTYGILRYPKLKYDLARAGLFLYGVLETPAPEESLIARKFHPALSLRARIATIRRLSCGESAGYGCSFLAKRPCRLAVLSIGYADGVPRCLSGSGGYVLIGGKRAPIAGNICMDQMTVDVTDIPDAKPGDEAVLIGQQGREHLPAEQVAQWAGTITNELLSRIGPRVQRMYVK